MIDHCCYCSLLLLLLLIGEGQFGEVWKAIAPGIVPGNHSRNIVAVKKLKGKEIMYYCCCCYYYCYYYFCIDSATYLDSNILLQELDIMKGITQHPNVINLLGYCTLPSKD